MRRVGIFWHWLSQHGLAIAFLGLFAACIVELFDCFGLDEATDNAVARSAATFYAPFYGREWEALFLPVDAHRPGQESIFMVLIDDASLDVLGEDNFPISYENQLQILQTVASYEPAAIFLDMKYTRPRAADRLGLAADAFDMLDAGSTDQDSQHANTDLLQSNPTGVEALAAGIREILSGSQTGDEIPVFIGPVGDDPLLEPLRGLKQVSLELPVDGYYEQIFEYRGSAASQPEPSEFMPAAVAIYSWLCATDSIPGDDESGRSLAERRERCTDAIKRLEGLNFFLQWGMGASEFEQDRLPEVAREFCGTARSPWKPTFQFMAAGALGKASDLFGISDIRAAADQCSYHDAMPYVALENELPDRILRDKIVMIGANTKTSGDNWPAPFSTQVPGLAVHAMALDNLIGNGPNVPVVPGQIGPFDEHSVLQVVTMVAMLGLLFMLTRDGRLTLVRQQVDGEVQVRRVTTGLIVCLTILACVFVAIVASVMGWPIPFVILNIIGPAGAAAVGLLIVSKLSASARPSAPATSEEQETPDKPEESSQ